MVDLVEHIDSHLAVAPSLSDMGWRVGISPSHFARKFRHSTGLSLYRFINRRRILRSLDTLRDESQSLAGVSLDLGFSSQSHFTRLFSKLTGMTPAKYRKQVRRVVG
ncbi:MAG: helix-turn-helix transcriptional regulator [Planctomycetia bacterium]